MILKLLSFTGCLPSHPLIDGMVQDVNFVLECQSDKSRKQSIAWKNVCNNLRNCAELWCVFVCVCVSLYLLVGELESKRETAHRIEEIMEAGDIQFPQDYIE